MMFTLYYVRREAPADTWSVRSEKYASIGDAAPVEGSDEFVSGNHTFAEAENKAAALQRESYGKRRQENADAAQG